MEGLLSPRGSRRSILLADITDLADDVRYWRQSRNPSRGPNVIFAIEKNSEKNRVSSRIEY